MVPSRQSKLTGLGGGTVWEEKIRGVLFTPAARLSRTAAAVHADAAHADVEGHQVLAEDERPGVGLARLGEDLGEARLGNGRAREAHDVRVDGELPPCALEHTPAVARPR